MRWSQTLIPTLKEVPQEAEIASHRLMLRAGLIRKLAGGLYTFLPHGLRALRNVEKIIREEMNRAGAIEVLMPALQPREIWEKSGRYTVLKDVMFKIVDRQNRHLLMGPTHEEIITDLVAHEIESYRQLPRTFYQIQAKFRDEIRPRFGLMRAKEFIMKDAYSFDVDEEGLDKSFRAMYDAYVRIFERCGLVTRAVEADSGAMGGSASYEFMVMAEAGEDAIAECDVCNYAANLERAERALAERPAAASATPPPLEVSTPGMRTIEAVSQFLKVSPKGLVKTLIYVADEKPIAVLVAGDRNLNELKLARALKATALGMADEQTIASVTGAPVGFAGPVGLRIPVYADNELRGATDVVVGGNKGDAHLIHVDLARDVQVTAFADLSFVQEGDGCPRCAGRLRLKRGIEVGHVFKLGTKYSKAFDACYLDAAGQKQVMIMGCYGIGVTRTLQAIIEQSHDANGIVWPMSTAPYQVTILPLNARHAESMKVAEELTAALESSGIDVLLDDRDERAGVKLKDADLLGFPLRVVVSERSLGEGKIELKLRTEPKPHMIAVADAVNHIGSVVL